MADVRTFIAVLLTDELKSRISTVQDQFKDLAPEVKWVARENLHVTLKFLGDVDSGRIEAVCSAMASAVEGVEAFSMGVSGVGAFPNPRRPRTVWVGLDSGAESLAEVAQRVDSALAGLGFPKEDRKFTGHVTIGRVKDERRIGSLPEALLAAKSTEFGAVDVAGITVMKSDLRREGPVYTVIKEIPLDRPQGGDDC